MDEETALIDANTRNEKIKNFLINNKSKIISLLVIIVILLIIFFSFGEYQKRVKENISDQFNSITINFKSENKNKTFDELSKIIEKKNSTYSPLALYFIIDNKLSDDRSKINSLFNILIDETNLENEIKNLIIYKKALYNADEIDENELLNILSPLNNSESVWKSHSFFLLGEYFYSKGEKQKAKDFFEQILSLDNSNPEIKIQAQKRLNRDLSE